MAVLASVLVLSGCGQDASRTPLDAVEAQRIRDELQDRSFRQFDPSRDEIPRRGVIVDFFGKDRIAIWGQFAPGNRAIHEWELVLEGYAVEGNPDGSEIVIRFDHATSRKLLPSICENCIETTEVSVGIRNVFDADRISFRLQDPLGVLPLPFPVFDSWTVFEEDEIYH